MEHAGGYLILFGLLVILTAQFTAFITALKNSLAQGLFCLIIPAYFLFYMRRKKTRMPKTLAAWYSGFVFIIVGVLIASI